jgi:RNA-binding protein
MIELTSRQRKVLEKHAQSLSAAVQVGQGGLSPEIVNHILNVMKTNELIKVKFNEFKDEKEELMKSLEEQTDITVVRIIGNTAILYKAAKEKDKRQFEKELAKA